MRIRMLAFVVVLVGAVACGKSEQQKQAEAAAENMKKAAEAMVEAAQKQGAEAATQGAGDMAKAMQGMAAAMNGAPDGKPVETVPFQTLQTHLPQVSGWDMDEPRGERMTMPVSFSQATGRYKKGEARIDAKIVDTGFATLLLTPWSMMLASGYSRETNDSYEKATTVAGHPAMEKWNTKSGNGEINVLVGKRFMVTLEGRHIDDVKQLQDFASNVDFGAIAAIK